VSGIDPPGEFFAIEEKHQDYYETNPTNGYCQSYVEPKVQQVRETFETEPSAARYHTKQAKRRPATSHP
jgi:peptide-methionine (S)-S-oxide reductase